MDDVNREACVGGQGSRSTARGPRIAATRVRVVGLLLCSVLAWHLVSVQVPEPPVLPVEDVQWSAPAGCPDRAALLAGVTRRLGRPLAPGELALDARVARSGPRWALRLQLVAGDRSERRELSADACAPLVDATALLVVHALAAATREAPRAEELEPGVGEVLPPGVVASEPLASDGPGEPIAAGPPPSEPGEEPGEEPLAAVSPPPAPGPRGPGLLLRVHGGAELGAVPGISGAVGLGVGLLWPRLRLEARGSFVAPRSATKAGTEISASLFAGSLHACLRPGRGALELPVCAGVEAGGMRGAASGPGANQAGVVPWLAVVLGAGASWRLRPRLALWSALELVGGAVRPNFVLRDGGDTVGLFRPSPVSGRLLVGLELRLGDRR